MSNYDQVDPNSSTSFDQTGSYSYFDPFTGMSYDIPTFTQTTEYSPVQEAINNETNSAKYNLATLANNQSDSLANLLSSTVDTSTLPSWGSASSLYDPNYSSMKTSAGLTNSFDSGGDITNSYGPEDGFSADRQRVEDALMQRLNPYLSQDKEALNTQLANQGLQPGSEAYDRALQQINAQQTDARLAVIGQAGDEQQRLNDMAAQQAGFENAAQQQQYSQNLSSASFTNAANQGTFDNYNGGTGANNSLEQQKLADSLTLYNTQNQDRENALNETFALRQEPINEITALLSGSQVAAPSFQAADVATIPTTDTAGLMTQEYDQQVQKAMADYSASSDMWGGLLGGAASLFSLSDERAKDDVSKIGKVEDGMNLYRFHYKGEPKSSPRHVGLMAQEVKKKKPSAVRKNSMGLYEVNYAKALGA